MSDVLKRDGSSMKKTEVDRGIQNGAEPALFSLTMKSVALGDTEYSEEVTIVAADTWYDVIPTIANYDTIILVSDYFSYDEATGIITWLGPDAVLEQSGTATVQHSSATTQTVHLGFLKVGDTAATTMGSVDTMLDNTANISVDTFIEVETGDQFKFVTFASSTGTVTLYHVDAFLRLEKITEEV